MFVYISASPDMFRSEFDHPQVFMYLCLATKTLLVTVQTSLPVCGCISVKYMDITISIAIFLLDSIIIIIYTSMSLPAYMLPRVPYRSSFCAALFPIVYGGRA
jgi:hypothetical protein